MGRIDQDLNDIIDETYQQGIEKGIVAIIKTLQDFDFSEEEIITSVLKQYDVSREKVLELMKQVKY